jgi:hypothetical protein
VPNFLALTQLLNCRPVTQFRHQHNLLDTWLHGYKRAEKLAKHCSDFVAQANFAGAPRRNSLKKIVRKEAVAC